SAAQGLGYQYLQTMAHRICFRSSVSQAAAHFGKRLRKCPLLHARARRHYFVAHQSGKILSGLCERRAKLIFASGNKFGGGRGSRRSLIGYKIGDSEIGFVAHGRNYGNRGSANRTRHFFSIEGPEVLS